MLDFFAYGLHQSWTDRTESIAAVPWRDDLRVEAMAAVDARRRRGAAIYSPGARIRHQLFRYRGHVFGREERGSPWPCVEGFWSGPGPRHHRDESLHADERRSERRGLSRKHIMHSIDNSLRRLGMDYVDLYQIHRFDASTPIEETLRALDDIVRAGKALYIGASAMYGWQFMKMLATKQSCQDRGTSGDTGAAIPSSGDSLGRLAITVRVTLVTLVGQCLFERSISVRDRYVPVTHAGANREGVVPDLAISVSGVNRSDEPAGNPHLEKALCASRLDVDRHRRSLPGKQWERPVDRKECLINPGRVRAGR